MRLVFGAVLAALGFTAAQPAYAGEGATPARGALASLPIAAAAITPTSIAGASIATASATGDIAGAIARPLTASLTDGIAAAVEPVAELRLPTVTLAIPAPAIAAEARLLRRRFTGNSMFEIYPVAGSGFHLSGGTRLYARRNFLSETETSARGVFGPNRNLAAPMATRPGFRRFNPALTAGYTWALSTAMRVGIEGGAMMGQLFAGAPGLPRGNAGYRSENAAHANPVANMVFGWRF